jgi:hypothetical protein
MQHCRWLQCPQEARANASESESDLFTKYGWIYIKQAHNDNLTSDPPSALLRAGA